MKYYNQNDYASIPYPCKSLPQATVKSGGCGVCTSANVLAFFGVNISIPDLAKKFMSDGARVDGGTDMKKAADIICKIGNLTYTTTSDTKTLEKHLLSGGIAIAHTGGDTSARKAVFSSAGHFINVIGNDQTPPKPFICFDVGYCSGKYDAAYRKPYVSVSKDEYGNTIQFTTADCLTLDTKTRAPSYYLFSKKQEIPVNTEPAEQTEQEPSNWAKEAWEWAKDKGITDGRNPLNTMTRQEIVQMLYNYDKSKGV